MFDDSRVIVYTRSKIWYHTVLFISFVIAILIIPLLQGKLSGYITNTYLLQLATYIIAYISAIYFIPELGFILVKSTMDD